MKKLIWVIIVLVALTISGVGVAAWATKGRNAATTQPAPIAEVTKGDIRTTVDATGNVVSNQDVAIKCKASGEVTKLPYDVSDIVHKGDLLIEVDPIYAQRSLDQAKASLASAQANLAVAQQNYIIAQQDLVTARLRATAALQSATASNEDAKNKLARVQDLFNRKLNSQEDLDTAKAAAAQASANLMSAQAQNEDLKSQEDQIAVKKQNINLAQASVANAQIQVDTAQQNFTDTKTIAPIDGVVSAVNIQFGTIVSSGITNVGGGTAAMTLSDMSHVYVMADVDESLIGKLITAGSKPELTKMLATAHGQHSRGGHSNWSGQGGGNWAGRTGGQGNATRPAASTESATAEADQGTDATTAPAGTQPAIDASGLTPLSGFDFTPAPLDVDITADAYQGVTFHGKVVQIATTGVNTSNVVTFQVKIEVTSPNRVLLRPQMTANVKIITEDHPDVLQVPVAAVQHKPRGGGDFVTVVDGDKTEERPVKLGMSNDDSSEIVSGLKEGEKVELHKNDFASMWAGGAGGASAGRRGPRALR